MKNRISLEPQTCNLEVYDFFHNTKIPFVRIEQTNDSKNSFSFLKEDNEDNKTCIERVFSIKLPSTIKIDYRIRTLHSSALAAVLCFHLIDSEHPIFIDGQKYTSVKFEWANRCTGVGGQSNVDIALFNDEEKQILLLEAKFSEYLSYSKEVVSPVYDEYYNSTYKKLLPEEFVYENNVLKSATKQSHYCEGIKQMICHHIGAKNMCRMEEYSSFTIKLGELLFQFPETDNKKYNIKRKERFEDYCKLYRSLATNINGINKSNIRLISDVMTYQTVFSDMENSKLILPRVKDYYAL